MALADARIKIDNFHWHIPHHTPCVNNKVFCQNKFSSKTSMEVRYVEGSVFMKEVSNQNLWIFELGGQGSTNVPIWINI